MRIINLLIKVKRKNINGRRIKRRIIKMRILTVVKRIVITLII